MPKTPEQWLEKAAPTPRPGIFKLFLGYAPGVGKTHAMLSEAVRRRNRGEDVVIGIIETHGRKGIADLAGQLESVPRKSLEYKGTIFGEMDVDAILNRHPTVALVDELAHTNFEGSRHPKRYEDVMEILEARIDVLATMNVQHVESLNPIVQSITGIAVRETVPDWVLDRADEIVVQDLTPEALETRMKRGDIYPTDRAEKALANFFRRGNLMALRELALKQVTRSVDKDLEEYLEQKKIDQNWGVAERIAVCISSNPDAQQLIARGARLARALDAECHVVYVESKRDQSPENQRTLATNIRFAEDLETRVTRLPQGDVARAVAAFVREQKITQVIFGHSNEGGWRRYIYLSAIQRFLRDAPPVDIHIVTQSGRGE
jgi:two-component system sensor histidine kinase KdpD